MTHRRLSIVFTTPFNWCDGGCSRCPLLSDCAVARRLDDRRQEHERCGRDPDDPGLAMHDVIVDLQSAIVMLEAVARRDGIDLDAPVEPKPISLDVERTRRAALDFAAALWRVVDGLDAQPGTFELREVLTRAVMLIPAKAIRLAYEWEDDVPEDTVPNLLLLERVGVEVQAALCAVADCVPSSMLEPCERARSRLFELLRPQFEVISGAERRHLDALVQQGRAPSPFATLAPDRESKRH